MLVEPARRIALVAALLVPTFTLDAQAVPAATDPERAAVERLRSDLRDLVTSQEMHYSQTAAYALSRAALGELYRASTGVTVEIVNPGVNGYAAVARLGGRTGSCVIFVGLDETVSPRTDVEKKRFSEGEPACDGDGIDERAHMAEGARDQVAGALIGVAKLQERQFGRTGAYAADIGSLEGFRARKNIVVVIERADVGVPRAQPSFLATAMDARYPGYSCVLRSGWGNYGTRAATSAEQKPARGDLEVACDTFR